MRDLSECAPYIFPNQQVNFNADSSVVKLSDYLTRNCLTDKQKVGVLFAYVCGEIQYDYEKMSLISSGEMSSGYHSDPDTTLESKSGTCLDYAVILAAMLRAKEIPTRLIKGYVSWAGDNNYIYHAWNEVWMDGAWQTYDAMSRGVSENTVYLPQLRF